MRPGIRALPHPGATMESRRDTAMLPIERILCPTDFSDASRGSVEAGVELARHFGAELILLHVVPVLPALPPDPNFVFRVPEFERLLHADAEKRLGELRAAVAGRDVPARVVVAHGSAADEILAVARRERADVVVIATHGSTGLGHLVFGSVAEKVVRHAECPVLTVRRPK